MTAPPSPTVATLMLGTVTSIDPLQVLLDGSLDAADVVLAVQHQFEVEERCILGHIGSTLYVIGTLAGLGALSSADVVFDDNGGAQLIYAISGPTIVNLTTAGAGTWTVPGGITDIKVEAVGAGGGGGGGAVVGTYGGAGGTGGEYAREDHYTVVPGMVIDYTIGTGGAGAPAGSNATNPGSDTWFGDPITGVVANGATGAIGSYTLSGGTGSTNSIHYNGGGNGQDGTTQAGGGGGGSGGSNSAGRRGSTATGNTAPGAGGVAVTGGGKGGAGGINTANGSAGTTPGGGGGGGGGGTGSGGHAGGNGANGKITISYGGTLVLVSSIAGLAGIDQYNNSYPAGVRTNYNPDTTGLTGGYYEEYTLPVTSIANGGSTLLKYSTLVKVLSDFSAAYNTSTGVWTCPADGVYTITAHVFITAVTAGLASIAWDTSAGAGAEDVRTDVYGAAGNSAMALSISHTAFYTAGTQRVVWAVQNSSVARNSIASRNSKLTIVRQG